MPKYKVVYEASFIGYIQAKDKEEAIKLAHTGVIEWEEEEVTVSPYAIEI